ncbi:MAG: DMT family transporter [Firmicutes bacterium]|nr:DMT family transporter [Bacillota bacterium]
MKQQDGIRQVKPTSYAALLMAGASYGFVTILVKWGTLHGLAVAQLTVFQYVVPLLAFGIWHGLTRRRTNGGAKQGDDWLIGGLMAATAISYYQCIRWLNPQVAVILLFQFVWMAPVITWLFARRSLVAQQWISVVVILAGTVLVNWPLEAARHGATVRGIIFGFGAALSYALTILLYSRTTENHRIQDRGSIVAFIGLLVALAVYRPYRFLANLSVHHAILLIATSGLIGIFGLMLPVALASYGAATLGSTTSTILSSVELPVTVGLSVVVLHEPLSLWHAVGIGVAVVGILLGITAVRR